MESLPRPPDSARPDFGAALEAWLEQIGWSKTKLAELAGISRMQIHRWTTGEKDQGPKGAAARKYEDFRQGPKAGALGKELAKLTARLEKIQGISWQDP